MFACYALVTAFVEYYAWVVSVIYYGVSHHLLSVFPSSSFHVFFRVAGGHCLYQSHSVARFHVLFPRCHVHPSHHVSAAFHLQVVRVVAEPCRYRHAHAGPFVACALCVSVYHHHSVVEVEHAVAEFGLSESCCCHHFVVLVALFVGEVCCYVIQVAVSPAPEVQSVCSCFGFQYCGAVCRYYCFFACEVAYLVCSVLFVAVGHSHCQSFCHRCVGFVFHFAFHAYCGCVSANVEVFGIDVHTCCLQVAV